MVKQTTMPCRHRGREISPKECDNTRTRREQLCRNANCPFVTDRKVEVALGRVGQNETVFCRGEEILARACLLRQARTSDGCGECAEPTRMCRNCGKTKKEALTAFDLKAGLCLECAAKEGSGLPLPDRPPPPAEEPEQPTPDTSPNEKAKMILVAIKALSDEIPGLTTNEAVRLLAADVNSAGKLRALGKEEALKLMTGRQRRHFGGLTIWREQEEPDADGTLKEETTKQALTAAEPTPTPPETKPRTVSTLQVQPDIENQESTERPKRTWDSIYPAVQRKLNLNDIYDLDDLASHTKYEIYNMGFDWRTVDFFAGVLQDNNKRFMTKAEKTATERVKAAAGPSASEKPLEATAVNSQAMEKIAADIAEIKQALEGVGEALVETVREGLKQVSATLDAETQGALVQNVFEAVKEAIQAMPQPQAEVPLVPGKITRAALESLVGKVLLSNLPDEALKDVLE